MNIIAELKSEYIRVNNSSFGGSQTYFANEEKRRNRMKNKGGCGIVAITDVISYLNKDTSVATIEDYKKRFNYTVRKALWIPTKMGMNYFHLTISMFFRLKKLSAKYRCYWCFSKKKLSGRIKKMLMNDIPVIISIPKSFKSNGNRDKLNLLSQNFNVAASTCGHFVVVTKLFEENQNIYLEISSWGQKYYISLNEFINFQKKHLIGILGNMLFIIPR